MAEAGLATGPDAPANAPLLAWAQTVVGANVRIVDRSRGFGQESVVWELHPTASDPVFLKRNASPLHYARELDGYSRTIPALEPVRDRFRLPRRLAEDESLMAFVMTRVPGESVDEMGMDHPDMPLVFRAAGAFVRCVHEVPIQPQTDAVTYLGDKCKRYLAARPDHVAKEDTQWALELIDDGRAFEGLPMVLTHSDFSPRNWLWDTTGDQPRLGVIDWERTRDDVWIEDAQRMTADHWHGREHLREAYFDGYGRLPTQREFHQLLVLSLVASVASIGWALTHNDPGFAELSRKRIERLRTGLST